LKEVEVVNELRADALAEEVWGEEYKKLLKERLNDVSFDTWFKLRRSNKDMFAYRYWQAKNLNAEIALKLIDLVNRKTSRTEYDFVKQFAEFDEEYLSIFIKNYLKEGVKT